MSQCQTHDVLSGYGGVLQLVRGGGHVEYCNEYITLCLRLSATQQLPTVLDCRYSRLPRAFRLEWAGILAYSKIMF